MKPSNYQMAIECLRLADRQHLTKATDCAMVESLAAQTYATLALVDEIRDMRSFVAEYLAAAEDVLANQKGGAK